MHKLMTIFVVVLMVTAMGAYAANLSSASANQLGGTGAVDVVAPTSAAVQVKWTVTSGAVSGATIVWTPSGAGTASYTSYVSVFSDDTCTTNLNNGSATEASVTQGSSHNTAVTFPSGVNASSLECVKVVILQN